MPSAGDGARSHVILVVEDDRMGLKPIRVTLEKAGYRVLEARSGRSVLDMLSQGPDLIIQDLVLPDMDGFELVRKIRALPEGADVPIIAYSGLMTALEETRRVEAGFTDYLFKPVAPARLLELVEAYLPSPDGHERAAAGQRLLVVDDDPGHRKLAKMRLERAGFAVATAEGATEALALARQSPPDLILSDILMPEIDGFRFCLAVREDPQLARVPFLLFSAAYNGENDRKLARDAGANGLVVKSPGFESVVEAVKSALAAPPPKAVVALKGLGEDYTSRIAQQLDRHMLLTANIRQRLMWREAELVILSSLFDSLRSSSGGEFLEEFLQRVTQVAGMSRAVVYLTGLNGDLLPRAKLGFPPSVEDRLGDFFGHARWLHLVMEEKAPRVAAPLLMPREILTGSEAPEHSALIAPLLQGDERLGVLVLMTGQRALSDEMLPFASAVGQQIGQAIGLARVLAQTRDTRPRAREPIDHSRSPDQARLLRAIIIDDDEERAGTVIRELQHDGPAPKWQRADSESEYLARLGPTVDLIVARLTTSHFSAQRALELLAAEGFEIPFIVISPATEQDAAAALLKGPTRRPWLRSGAAPVPNSIQEWLMCSSKWSISSTQLR